VLTTHVTEGHRVDRLIITHGVDRTGSGTEFTDYTDLTDLTDPTDFTEPTDLTGLTDLTDLTAAGWTTRYGRRGVVTVGTVITQVDIPYVSAGRRLLRTLDGLKLRHHLRLQPLTPLQHRAFARTQWRLPSQTSHTDLVELAVELLQLHLQADQDLLRHKRYILTVVEALFDGLQRHAEAIEVIGAGGGLISP
jgi:hypothetical protein